MRALVHDPGRASLRRASRVALAMPALFAVCLVSFESNQVASFAAFGSFAMLVFADFGGPTRRRLGAYLALTAGGGVLIVAGTLVNDSIWLSAVVMALVAFAIAFGSVFGGYLAAGGLTATLAFVLAVAVPASTSDLPARLTGWGLAGAVSAAAALVLWPRHERSELRRSLCAAMLAAADLVDASGAHPFDAELAAGVRSAALEATRTATNAYRTMPYRPAGPTAHDQALAYLVDELPWLHGFADDLVAERLAGAALSREDEALLAATGRALRDVATELRTGEPHVDRAGLEVERDRYYTALVERTRRRIAAGEPSEPIAAALGRAFRLRLLSYASLSALGNVSILAGGLDGPETFEIAPLVPPTGRRDAVASFTGIVRSHLRLDSVWLQAGLRAALGLGLAVTIADLLRLQHAFWVVLATLTVLKSNAVSTRFAAWQALVGTLAGFGLATVVVVGVGDGRPALWALLPVCVFLAAYTPTAVHVVVGQAMFTVTVVVLFNLIEPQGWRTGLIRIEDILIGAATSVIVGTLLWPRGARAQLRRSLAAFYERAGEYVRAALGAALDKGVTPGSEAGAARAASLRAGDALATYLNERGPKPVPIGVWAKLLSTGEQLRLVGDAVVVRTATYGQIEGFRAAVAAVEEEVDALGSRIEGVARAVAGAENGSPVDRVAPGGAETTIRAWLGSCGSAPSHRDVEQLLGLAWVGEWIVHAERRLAALAEPLEEIKAFATRAWWR